MAGSAVFLIAPQRSGTTVFQKTLAKGAVFDAHGELFHESHLDFELNFFNYITSNEKAGSLYLSPSKINIETLFDSYLQFIASKSNKSYHIIDTKENSLHHFESFWHDVYACPNLISLCINRSIPIIRIRRKNLFNQTLSQDVSNALQIWHIPQNKEIEPIQIKINPNDYLSRMIRFKKEGDFIDSFVSDYNQSINLLYEDLFDETGMISDNVGAKLAQMLSINPDHRHEPFYKKTIRNPATFVQNIDEVLSFFEKIPIYGQMATDALT